MPAPRKIPGRNGGTLTPWPKGVSGNPVGRIKGSGRPIICGIYLLTFTDGSTYIGASRHVRHRWDTIKSHYKLDRLVRELQRAWEISGEPTFELITECHIADLGNKEQEYIERMNPSLNKNQVYHNLKQVRYT